MAKNNQKSKEKEAEVVDNAEVVAEETAKTEEVVEKKPAKKEKKQKPVKVKVNKEQKRSRLKEIFSELKKVSWPTFPKIVKQTGIVLVVVVAFLVVISAFDFGLLQLLNLVSPKA